jgi:hypothetical protein
MNLSEFLSAPDNTRIAQTLRVLTRHNLSGLALTGGLAIELNIRQRGASSMQRPLHDIDFVAPTFDCIPQSLAQEFLFRHVHPDDPPGKTLLQAVLPETAVRVDVFRAYGSVMNRASTIALSEFPSVPIYIVAIEDLAARHARFCWDLSSDQPVAPKYARDFLRMLKLVNVSEVEKVWPEHRKPSYPATFAEVAGELCMLITGRPDLLAIPDYSTNINENCVRCRSTDTLPLAGACQILSLLGYC